MTLVSSFFSNETIFHFYMKRKYVKHTVKLKKSLAEPCFKLLNFANLFQTVVNKLLPDVNSSLS